MVTNTLSRLSALIRLTVTTLRRDGVDRFVLLSFRHISYSVRFHRWIGNRPTRVSRAVYALVVACMTATVRVLRRVHPHKYTDADPYKVFFVSPDEITYLTGEPFSKRRGWVVAGDWDDGDLFMKQPYPNAIRQHYSQGVPWEKTTLRDRIPNPHALENRAREIERLYRSIDSNGFRSQRELLEESPEAAWSGLNDSMHPAANEITVDIGRDGELLWNMCGQHRLAIAKVLDVDRLPVQVFRRHADWQAIRDRARRGEDIPEELRDHPDLADVITEE